MQGVDNSTDSGQGMKAYINSIEAIRTRLRWLESRNELNYTELERRQVKADVPQSELLSAEMIRMFHLGKVKTFSAERAESFCRVMGIQFSFVDTSVPENFK